MRCLIVLIKFPVLKTIAIVKFLKLCLKDVGENESYISYTLGGT